MPLTERPRPHRSAKQARSKYQTLPGLILLLWLSAIPAMADTPLARGLAYLFGQQSKDGAWRSSRHKPLDGASLTAYALHAALCAPTDARKPYARQIARAQAYLVKALADPRKSGHYPNYARAYLLRSLVRTGQRPATRKKLVDLLKAAQLVESRGWRRADTAYGGWDIAGDHRKPLYSYLNISVTRVVLESLRAAGVAPTDPVFVRARIFIGRCQDAAGGSGLCFSPAVPSSNKAGRVKGQFLPYGSATADGLRAMVACGGETARIKRARVWLLANLKTDRVPGFIHPVARNWRKGLLHYYLSSAAVALRSDVLRKALATRQRPDGSWAGTSPLMMEDEPILATALALEGLAKP